MKNGFRLTPRIQASILVVGLPALRESYVGLTFWAYLLLTEGSR